jgi:heme exporter protein CcmD
MIEFFNMDGYGIYIWPAYAIAFSLISILYFKSVKQLKRLEKEIQALEQKVAAEKIKTSRSSISQTA